MAETAENLDLPIAMLIADRLAEDAQKRNDLYLQIKRMDAQIGTYFELMNVTNRIKAYPDIAEHYRNKGLALGDIRRKPVKVIIMPCGCPNFLGNRGCRKI